jgi:hypothetical protein
LFKFASGPAVAGIVTAFIGAAGLAACVDPFSCIASVGVLAPAVNLGIIATDMLFQKLILYFVKEFTTVEVRYR